MLLDASSGGQAAGFGGEGGPHPRAAQRSRSTLSRR